jgi:hypothetical protein
MAEFPYSPTPTSIPKFLSHIQSAGVPGKVTLKYLESVGFKSTNDRALIPVLKAINFIDSSGQPSQHWRDYRDKGRARSVLGEALRSGYADLFETFPDAQAKDNETLRNFFSARSNLAENTLALVVRTFKTLCEQADFDSVSAGSETGEHTGTKPPAVKAQPNVRPLAAALPSVNINIQLHIPETTDSSVYDNFFAALKKHLLTDGSSD